MADDARSALNDWLPASVGAMLIDSARSHPTRPALQWLDGEGLKSLSWQQLLGAATAGAKALRSCADRDAPVAVWGPNSPAWYVLLWSAALAGRPLVPINPNLTEREARVLLQDSGAGTVLASIGSPDQNLLDRAKAASAGLPGVRAVVELDTWFRAIAESSGPDPQYLDDFEVGPEEPFLIQYTSGTTGTAKGAVLSHQACLNAARTLVARTMSVEHEIWCSPMPLHHVGGSIALVLAPAAIAGTYVMVTDFSADKFVRAAGESRATLMGGVPTLFLRILDDSRLAEVTIPSLRALLLGGASIPSDLVARMDEHFGAPVVVMYGQSEAPAITSTGLDDDVWTKAHTVGSALPHRELKLIDVATGAEVGLDEVGEICVRTRAAMDCYLNRPAQTAETIDSDGWLHTGDLGALDGQGRLHFRGRIKEMIIRGGENIYAREVEDAIESHPGVALVAVVGLPDPRFGEIVVAAVVPRAGSTVSRDELDSHARSRLAPFKRPVQWHVMDALPLTASGKPQKFKIVEMLQEGR